MAVLRDLFDTGVEAGSMREMRLYINIDHVATVRQARLTG